jgi:hypothetical protein
MPILETFSASTARMPNRIPIRRVTPKIKPPARPAHRIQIKGAVAEAERAGAEAEVAAGVEVNTRKGNGIAFSTRRKMTIVPIIAQKRKDLRLFLKKKGKDKERASTVNHSAPAWQNPSFGRNSFANPFQPPQFQPHVPTYTQIPPLQSQTFQTQNIESRPIEHQPITPPPPPFKGPTAPPIPSKLEGQNDPLPSVGSIMPISGGSVLEFEKKERKHYFREVRNICVEGRVERMRWSHIPITFSEDVRLQGFPHNDALIIEANIASWTLGKLLVDNGSSADIIFADAFDKMGLSKDLFQPPDTPLYGFGGRIIHALGKVVLLVSFETVQNARTEYLSFNVVQMYYPYNGILGRGFLNKFEAVIHQAYLCIKIPAMQRVITIWGHQNDGCNLERGRTPGQRNVHALNKAVKGKEVEKQPKADREKVNMQPDCDTKRVLLDVMVVDQTVVIGSDLSPEEEGRLVQFLQKNKDVFAWSAKDLTGVDRSFIEHRLNIDPSVKSRRQNLRKMSDDKVVAVKSEVQRLLDATVIREVMYPKWLADTVPVKKKNGKWRMCIDFTDLNKATPKDNYPLPRMDQVIDSAANVAIMSLLNCFSGYHQCWMTKEDEEKTNFITPFGTF